MGGGKRDHGRKVVGREVEERGKDKTGGETQVEGMGEGK